MSFPPEKETQGRQWRPAGYCAPRPPSSPHLPSPPTPAAKHNPIPLSVSLNSLSWASRIGGIIRRLSFWVWRLSPSVMLSRFTRAVARYQRFVPLYFVPSVVRRRSISFPRASASGHLGCVHVSGHGERCRPERSLRGFTEVYVPRSRGHVPRSGIVV